MVRQGKLAEAEAALTRLQSPDCPVDPKQTLSTIVYTDNLEKELSVGTSYKDCFKGFELRRTEIACISFMGQVMCGTVRQTPRMLPYLLQWGVVSVSVY